jgi:hypothetical protein
MAKRASLFQVTEAPTTQSAASIAEPTPTAPPTSASRPASRQGKKVLSVFLERAAWKQLRDMATDEGTSTQALGVEAINLLFAARGKGRLA